MDYCIKVQGINYRVQFIKVIRKTFSLKFGVKTARLFYTNQGQNPENNDFSFNLESIIAEIKGLRKAESHTSKFFP